MTSSFLARTGVRRSGFTLIELLVVVAIIALLVGLLLPALGAARKSARMAVDMGNLKSMAIAAAAYDVDFREYPLGYMRPEEVLGSRIEFDRTNFVGYGFGGMTNIQSGSPSRFSYAFVRSARRPLNPYMVDDLGNATWDNNILESDENRTQFEMFRSPSDDKLSDSVSAFSWLGVPDRFYNFEIEPAELGSIYEIFGTSYYMNTWVRDSPGFGDPSDRAGSNVPDVERYETRLTRILRDIRNSQSPSRFVLFHEFPVQLLTTFSSRVSSEDSIVTNAQIQPGWYADDSTYFTTQNDANQRFASSSRYLVSFADGHADFAEAGFANFIPNRGENGNFIFDDVQRPGTGDNYTFANTRFMAERFWER